MTIPVPRPVDVLRSPDGTSGGDAAQRLSPVPITVPLEMADVLRAAGEYEQAGRYDAAIALLGPILAAAPQLAEARHMLARIALRQGRLPEAAEMLEPILTQGVQNALVFRDACTLYERLGRYDDALAAGQRAIELDPFDPHAYHNLGVAYYRMLRLDESIACARRALELSPELPEPHLGLAEALLLRGDLQAGWEEYEWRFRQPAAQPFMPPTDRPHWNGAPLPGGALLLIADQGFGDVIQFSRYIPWAAQRCPDLVLACGPEMRGLLGHAFPGLRMFQSWDACPDFAAFCPLSGLPRLHGTRLDGGIAPHPILRAEPGRAAAWARRLAQVLPPGYRRIGIAWAGRPHPPNRSASLPAFAPIAALDGIALVSLQLGEAQAEIGRYHGRAPLVNLGPEIADFMDTAAILVSLDLVISIDTATAHLAAAMGKPTCILLPYAPDWRWLLHRGDSPWYPSARLFRQPSPQEWAPVFDRVAKDIATSL